MIFIGCQLHMGKCFCQSRKICTIFYFFNKAFWKEGWHTNLVPEMITFPIMTSCKLMIIILFFLYIRVDPWLQSRNRKKLHAFFLWISMKFLIAWDFLQSFGRHMEVHLQTTCFVRLHRAFFREALKSWHKIAGTFLKTPW